MSQQPRRTRQIVIDTVLELHASEQIITRESVTEASGLPRAHVDEHLKKLVEDEVIRRVERGVYAPIEVAPPARAVSVTYTHGGLVKLEIGDLCLDLWPREARAIGTLLYGHAQAFTAAQLTREMGELGGSLANRIRKLESMREAPEGQDS